MNNKELTSLLHDISFDDAKRKFEQSTTSVFSLAEEMRKEKEMNRSERLLSMFEELEIWQMTKAEYEKKHGKERGNTTVTGGFSSHKSAVETALNRGKKVPAAVLADYPDLKESLDEGAMKNLKMAVDDYFQDEENQEDHDLLTKKAKSMSCEEFAKDPLVARVAKDAKVSAGNLAQYFGCKKVSEKVVTKCRSCNGKGKKEMNCKHCGGEPEGCRHCSDGKVTGDCPHCEGEGSREDDE